MFNKGDILINKKNPSLVVLIMTEAGDAKVLESNKWDKGKAIQCTEPKFYEKVTDTEKYLKQTIVAKYKKEKNIQIPEYL